MLCADRRASGGAVTIYFFGNWDFRCESIARLEREEVEVQRRRDELRIPLANATTSAALAKCEAAVQAQSFDADAGQFEQMVAVLERQKGGVSAR